MNNTDQSATGTTKVITHVAGVDKSFLGDNQRWWFDPSFPHAFSIFDLDGFYNDDYFRQDHVGPKTVHAYVDNVLQFGSELLGKPIQSVLEAGCGGGWFTQEFARRGIDVFGVEGTHSGFKRTVERGVDRGRVMRHDLRRPLKLDRQFDIVLCTEVAEHVETPFSSQLIKNLVDHSQLIWFSFEEPGSNSASYHHCNEQPEAFWVNLFRFYGYRMQRLPAHVVEAVEHRGRMIFCGPRITSLRKEDEGETIMGLGMTNPAAVPVPSLLKRLAKGATPPFLWNAMRKVRQ